MSIIRRSILSAPIVATLAFLAAEASAQAPAGPEPDRADRPPRKVVVGTSIFFPGGEYPGLGRRLERLAALVDRMAGLAASQYPGEGLDLAILPESAVTRSGGAAAERATTLDEELARALGAIARKHRTYLVAPLDLAEECDGRPIRSNAAILFDREGRVAGLYRKAHPVAVVGTDELEAGITPGDAFPVFDCDFGKLGIQICWDIQFEDGWGALARGGAEIVAWPSASPAKTLPAARALSHRYYVVSSTWRDNATIYEPTGMVAARVGPDPGVLVHRIDLSHAILGWSASLRNGAALKEKFGDRVDFHYDQAEDMGLFWSNDPAMTIGAMVRSIGGEPLDRQVARNRRLHEAARGR